MRISGGIDQRRDYLEMWLLPLCAPIVVGWGKELTDKKLQQYYELAKELLLPCQPKCFGVTKDGAPRHPLYLPNDTPLQDWPVR